MDFIFDDTLGKDLDHLDVCMQKIDIFFYDDEEAYLLKDLSDLLDDAFAYIDDEIGGVDVQYMNYYKWPQIVARAAEIYKLMKANNEKYNFIECYNMFVDRHQEYRQWQEEFRLERSQDI